MKVGRRAGWLIFVMMLGSTAGCATARPDGGQRQQNVLTRAEMAPVKVSSLYEVVRRLRPRWLRISSGPRSITGETEVVVFQGQAFLGGTEVLRQMSPDMVVELRYLDGAQASAALPGLGSRHVAGAIVIVAK
ncbi:MAG TPA: hypothetical protein VF188_03150 [Longimicrobiales bacterium]